MIVGMNTAEFGGLFTTASKSFNLPVHTRMDTESPRPNSSPKPDTECRASLWVIYSGKEGREKERERENTIWHSLCSADRDWSSVQNVFPTQRLVLEPVPSVQVSPVRRCRSRLQHPRRTRGVGSFCFDGVFYWRNNRVTLSYFGFSTHTLFKVLPPPPRPPQPGLN